MGRTHSSRIPVGVDGVTPFVAWLNRWRITIGAAMLAAALTPVLLLRDGPHHVHEPNGLVIGALALIAAGTLIRLTALGTIDKNKSLAVTGVYSLCRNPLYVGSTLLYLGFALLMDDAAFLFLGVPYMVLFFGAAAFAEEHFLRSKFGPLFERYRHSVPGFVPLGRWTPSEGFSWRRSMSRGGLQLLAAVIGLLVAIELMAIEFGHVHR